MIERSFTRALARLSEVDSLRMTRQELFELWSVARDLERVADHAKRIGSIACELDSPPDGDHATTVQSLAKQARAVVEDAVSSIVDTENVETVCEALTLRSHVREEVVELDRQLFRDGTADYRLARILDSVQRTAEHGGNIAERGLQRKSRHRNGESNPMTLLADCDCEGLVNVLESST